MRTKILAVVFTGAALVSASGCSKSSNSASSSTAVSGGPVTVKLATTYTDPNGLFTAAFPGAPKVRNGSQKLQNGDASSWTEYSAFSAHNAVLYSVVEATVPSSDQPAAGAVATSLMQYDMQSNVNSAAAKTETVTMTPTTFEGHPAVTSSYNDNGPNVTLDVYVNGHLFWIEVGTGPGYGPATQLFQQFTSAFKLS